MRTSQSGSPLFHFALLCALVFGVASCGTNESGTASNNSKPVANTGNVNGPAVVIRDPPGSEKHPVEIPEDKYKKATIEVFWPTDELDGAKEALEIFVVGKDQVPSPTKKIDLNRKHGKEPSFTLTPQTGTTLKNLRFNLPRGIWDVAIVNDAEYDANLSSVRKVTVLFIERKPDDPSNVRAGGSFTTPIGFTVTLSTY